MIKGYTYILTNKNFSVLYVGATKDLKARIECHKDGTGAVFTKKYNVTTLIYFEEYDNYRDAFIRENWDFIRHAGMRTVMDVDTTFGDIVQLISTGLPIAVGVVIVGAIFGGGKVCPPRGQIRRDPYTGQDNSEVTFDVVGKDEQCPN